MKEPFQGTHGAAAPVAHGSAGISAPGQGGVVPSAAGYQRIVQLQKEWTVRKFDNVAIDNTNVDNGFNLVVRCHWQHLSFNKFPPVQPCYLQSFLIFHSVLNFCACLFGASFKFFPL